MAVRASAGHKLGQLIGDWFEQYFVLPLLTQVATQLGLFLDNCFQSRKARGDKLLWQDIDENLVDYDFVLELNGTDEQIGIPVAFFESFWRRGSRHSKDKARDDSGKLRPMRATYPTARFLGIVAAGDFTTPARELILSRNIDLFYVPKEKLVNAFIENKLTMDYPDRSSEEEKQLIATAFEERFSQEAKKAVAESLSTLLGKATIKSYVDRVRSKLSALPQEIRLVLRQDSLPMVFETIQEASVFLQEPQFPLANANDSYLYQITYSDGSEFERLAMSLLELKELHGQITLLAEHMNKL